ncbi:MAG: two-component system response regulator [Nitrospinae bacterium CG11_big_fil_rev_8_21_14_0_20_56_8]|nr:MAG: two-component system response regulator [Nitrospinae bacterium CG11_big_fil_rev_8_21_14_0_20_56_8]
MKKILIVDDNESIRELVLETLGPDLYQILECDNGMSAIDLARTEKPDLIIMDIMMPGDVDGVEATRIIKQDSLTRNCCIILLTAKGQLADQELGFAAGADDYFIKPFSPMQLIAKVEEVLEKGE